MCFVEGGLNSIVGQQVDVELRKREQDKEDERGEYLGKKEYSNYREYCRYTVRNLLDGLGSEIEKGNVFGNEKELLSLGEPVINSRVVMFSGDVPIGEENKYVANAEIISKMPVDMVWELIKHGDKLLNPTLLGVGDRPRQVNSRNDFRGIEELLTRGDLIVDDLEKQQAFYKMYREMIHDGLLSTQAPNVARWLKQVDLAFKDMMKDRQESEEVVEENPKPDEVENDEKQKKEIVWLVAPNKDMTAAIRGADEAMRKFIKENREYSEEQIRVIETSFPGPFAEIIKQVIEQATERGYKADQIDRLIELSLQNIEGGILALNPGAFTKGENIAETVKKIVEEKTGDKEKAEMVSEGIIGAAEDISAIINAIKPGLIVWADRENGKTIVKDPKVILKSVLSNLASNLPMIGDRVDLEKVKYNVMEMVIREYLASNELGWMDVDIMIGAINNSDQLDKMLENLRDSGFTANEMTVSRSLAVNLGLDGNVPFGFFKVKNWSENAVRVLNMPDDEYNGNEETKGYKLEKKRQYDEGDIPYEEILNRLAVDQYLIACNVEGVATPEEMFDDVKNLVTDVSEFINGGDRYAGIASDLNNLNQFPVPDADTGTNSGDALENSASALNAEGVNSLQDSRERWNEKTAGGNSANIHFGFWEGFQEKVIELSERRESSSREIKLKAFVAGVLHICENLDPIKPNLGVDVLIKSSEMVVDYHVDDEEMSSDKHEKFLKHRADFLELKSSLPDCNEGDLAIEEMLIVPLLPVDQRDHARKVYQSGLDVATNSSLQAEIEQFRKIALNPGAIERSDEVLNVFDSYYLSPDINTDTVEGRELQRLVDSVRLKLVTFNDVIVSPSQSLGKSVDGMNSTDREMEFVRFFVHKMNSDIEKTRKGNFGNIDPLAIAFRHEAMRALDIDGWDVRDDQAFEPVINEVRMGIAGFNQYCEELMLGKGPLNDLIRSGDLELDGEIEEVIGTLEQSGESPNLVEKLKSKVSSSGEWVKIFRSVSKEMKLEMIENAITPDSVSGGTRLETIANIAKLIAPKVPWLGSKILESREVELGGTILLSNEHQIEWMRKLLGAYSTSNSIEFAMNKLSETEASVQVHLHISVAEAVDLVLKMNDIDSQCFESLQFKPIMKEELFTLRTSRTS